MVVGDIEARVRRLVEDGIGRGDLAVIEALVAPDGVEHQRGHGRGVDGVRQLAEDLHRRLADLELRVEDIAVVGDRVWLRSRARGVSVGMFMGLPPTGQPVEVRVFDVVRIADGRVVEHWGVADQLGLLLQLGFDPARDTTAAAQ
jgi:predicted ester cyclase